MEKCRVLCTDSHGIKTQDLELIGLAEPHTKCVTMGELTGKSQNVHTFCFVYSWISLAKVNKMHLFLMLLCINLSIWGVNLHPN